MKKEAQGDNQTSIDMMSEHLFERFQQFLKEEDLETMKAIMDEWLVDGRNPEDGDYEFTFVPSLIDN